MKQLQLVKINGRFLDEEGVEDRETLQTHKENNKDIKNAIYMTI